jgi:hypothetical protein
MLGHPRDRVPLAGRFDIDERSLERLLMLHDDAVDAALAENLALLPGDAAFAELIERARLKPETARVFLARADLPAADQAALYLAADAERRSQIRAAVAASALFQRPHLRFRLTQTKTAEFLATAEAGDVRAFENMLGATFGLPHTVQWRILAPGRHELLALALRALGVEEDDALRIFLTLHPAISHSVEIVFGSVRILRTVARPTALALVEAILGARTAFATDARHQPAMDPSGTPSLPSSAKAERKRREDPVQRLRGG